MTTRLPKPGGDDGSWGDILNDYLSQSHNADGSIKDNVVTPAALAGDIPQTKITNLQTDITGKINIDQTTPQTIINGQPIQDTLTASQLVSTDANKKLQTLPVATYPSLTELSYVKGLTSGAQGQLADNANQINETIIDKARYFLQLNKTGLDCHRGYDQTNPENTLKSIEAAARLGFEVVEIDLYKTSDNVLVLMHDSTVNRTTDGTGTVNSMTLAQIKVLKVDYPSNTISTEEIITVPTFEEAVNLCKFYGLVINMDCDKFDWSQSDMEMALAILKKYNMQHRAWFNFSSQSKRELLISLEPTQMVLWLSSNLDPTYDIAETKKYKNAIVAYSSNIITDSLLQTYFENGVTILVSDVITPALLYKYSNKGVRFVQVYNGVIGGIQ